MNHHRKSPVTHRRHALQKIRRSRLKYSIVGLLPTQQGNQPMIMICGEWLYAFGFRFNQRLKVTSSLGKIVIESLSNETEPDMHAKNHVPPSPAQDFAKNGMAAIEHRLGEHFLRQLRHQSCPRER